MEDFPAGPASPGPGRLCLSVVVPVYNGGPTLELCLRRLRDSDWTEYEIIVVDDGSTDNSAAVALGFGASVIHHDKPRGPAAARNAGAKAAAAPIVFFLDADVTLHPDALRKAAEHFARHPNVAAVFGSYDNQPAAPGIISRYRNLLHHYVHQQGRFDHEGARPVHTFWTGCGAVRRNVFLEAGGFDPQLYPKPAIEDIELGYRITEMGRSIALLKDVQATHHKRWTLRHVIVTDIFHRGVPWMLLQWRRHVQETDLNVQTSQKLCVAAVGLSLLAGPAAFVFPWLAAVPVLTLVAVILLNHGFYRLLARQGGWMFAIASAPAHAVYYACCGLSVVIATGLWFANPSRRLALPSRRRNPLHFAHARARSSHAVEPNRLARIDPAQSPQRRIPKFVAPVWRITSWTGFSTKTGPPTEKKT